MELKKTLYPNNILITEDKVEVPLRDLVEITVIRLLEALNLGSDKDYHLTIKYGFDGTTAPLYRQKRTKAANALPETDDGAEEGDESPDKRVREDLFCTCLVPLILVEKESQKVIWKNETPNSSRFCRPVRINFVKEDTKLSLLEYENLKKEIADLEEINLSSGGKCTFTFQMSMLDGKVS